MDRVSGPNGAEAGRSRNREDIPADRPVLRVLAAALVPFVALAVQWTLWDYFKPYVWFLFFPAAFFSAWIGGLVGGLLGTVIGALLVWYCFMPPMFSFALDQLAAPYSIVVFLAMGGLFSVFHERMRRAMRRSDEALAVSREANEETTRLYHRTLALDERKSRFFDRISHELRTPLTLILAPLEEWQRWQAGRTLSEADCREMEGMLRNARLLHRYVVDLLEAAKIEAGQVTLACAPVDLVPVVRSLASHFESIAAKRRIDYVVSVPESVPAEADVEKLQRIVLDLLANAFSFVPDGGKVVLRLTTAGSSALIEIEDNGSSIPPGMHDAVFERFPESRIEAPRRKDGRGLGLSIVRDFVELHGGTIGVDEPPGGGVRFRVRLPREASAGTVPGAMVVPDAAAATRVVAELERPAPRGLPAPNGSGESDDPLVLVVEDDPFMNDFITRTLQRHYRVCSAFDGMEGAEKAMTLQPDLIVTDLMMPVLDGEGMLARLRGHEVTADIPVVVISACADDKTRLGLLGDGVQDYLAKPFSTNELLARVGGLVKSRRRTVAELARSAGRLRHLAEVVEKIAAVRDVPSLMAIVRHAVRDLTGADGATLVMRDGGDCHYVDEDAIGPLWKGRRFPLESCISGWAMLHAQAVVIEDIYADPRIPYAAYRPTFVKSLSMVPIGRTEPVGAIGCYWATRHRASAEELELQRALADAMSVGLANLELYRRIKDAMEVAEASAVAAQGSEKRFRRLFQEAPVPLCFVDGKGMLVDCNQRFEQMFGYGRADVPTLADWWRLAYPDPAYRAGVMNAWNAAVARAAAMGHDIEAAEYRVTCREGRERIVLVSGIVLGEDLLVTFFDITERRQAEEALRRQTDELIRRNEELERFNRASVGREMEMIRLKQEVNALASELGKEAPYALAFVRETDESGGRTGP